MSQAATDDSSQEEVFAKAVERHTAGDFTAALDFFDALLPDPKWLDRVRPHVDAICRKLRASPDLNDSLIERLSRIEAMYLRRPGRPVARLPSWARREEAKPRRISSFRRIAEAGGSLWSRVGSMIGLSHQEDRSDLLVEKTPHMDISTTAPLKEGNTFTVLVYLDDDPARSGEQTWPVSGHPSSSVTVKLVTSGHFEVVGSSERSLVLERESPRLDFPAFELQVRHSKFWTGRPGLLAVFFVDGKPCGKVERYFDLSSASGGPDTVSHGQGARFRTQSSQRADLEVTVATDPSGDSRRYWVMVDSPHFPSGQIPGGAFWDLPDTSPVLVAAFLDEFADEEIGDRLRAELRGAGTRLFAAAPENFRQLFWALLDAGKTLRTIQIVSAEPHIPWELMVPCRRRADGTWEEFDMPLGVNFLVGRWPDPKLHSPLERVKLEDSHVIAPEYDAAADGLKWAENEATIVLDHYPGVRIVPASFRQVTESMRSTARTLVHFACHGSDDGRGMHSLRLEGTDKLTSNSLMGIPGLRDAFSKCPPVVFLNACEVGRTAQALIGVGGLATAFIELGAAAVIAPLWSVSDCVACEVASEFYTQIKREPAKPFSEILANIRARAYDPVLGRDTYASYCFFGNPFACASSNR